MRSQREGIHQPAEHDRRGDEAAEQHAAKSHLLPDFVFREQAEDKRHEKGERHEQEQNGCALLAAERGVVGVDHHQQIQQSGHDEERVAVLVGDRGDIAAAAAQCVRDEIRHADAGISNRGKADEGIR